MITQNKEKGLEDSTSEFQFKPLTSGLGFETTHEDGEKLLQEQRLKRRYKQPNFPPLKSSLNSTYHGQLEPFYNENISPPLPQMSQNPYDREEETAQVRNALPSTAAIDEMREKAYWGSRILAYFVDFTLIASVFVATVAGIFLALKVPLNKAFIYQFLMMGSYHIITIFLLYYLFYFTFMDQLKSSSLGKSLFGIKVCDNRGDQISLSQSFSRSFLSLLDVISLGILSSFSFKEILSNTQVIKSFAAKD